MTYDFDALLGRVEKPGRYTGRRDERRGEAHCPGGNLLRLLFSRYL